MYFPVLTNCREITKQECEPNLIIITRIPLEDGDGVKLKGREYI